MVTLARSQIVLHSATNRMLGPSNTITFAQSCGWPYLVRFTVLRQQINEAEQCVCRRFICRRMNNTPPPVQTSERTFRLGAPSAWCRSPSVCCAGGGPCERSSRWRTGSRWGWGTVWCERRASSVTRRLAPTITWHPCEIETEVGKFTFC